MLKWNISVYVEGGMALDFDEIPDENIVDNSRGVRITEPNGDTTWIPEHSIRWMECTKVSE